MDENKITSLLQDEAFVTKLSECGSLEEIQEAFTAAGCDITPEQAKGFVESLDKICGDQADELSEENLENVSGGIIGVIWPIVWTKVLLDLWYKRGWLSKKKWKSILLTIKA